MIIDKRDQIPWYIMALLSFKPAYYLTDYDKKDEATLSVKYLFGKTYVLAEIYADDEA